ncbi:MAG: 3'-5' exonuclease [Verrucomicrobia bacterium]|nr:MAG: 3'-5' exonuclease [Verrucomicrobiota bacterium]
MVSFFRFMESEFTYVDSPDGVSALTAFLEPHEVVALDTEADNLHHYATRVCLLQIAAGGEIYLIDPLAGLDLSGLFRVLEPKLLIMHGSDFDLRLLWEHSRFKPREVFDTMLAAQLLGRSRIGLSSLLDEILGIHHPKDSQKSDWSKRPLSKKMLDYAARDVKHLHRLHEAMAAELERLGRSEWHRQRCQLQIEVAAGGFPDADPFAWRIGPSRDWPPRAVAALYELWHWRDAEARRLDRPPFKVMTNDYLKALCLAVAEGNWRDAYEALPRGLKRGRARGLLQALERGAKRDPASLPKREKRSVRPAPLNARELSRQDALKDHRDREAEKLGIDPTLIATRAQIAQIAREPDAAAEVLLPWQVGLLEPVLAGKLFRNGRNTEPSSSAPR